MSKRRGNGEGCIRQLKDGSWEARIMIGYNEKGSPKFKTFTSKKRSVVVQKLSEYIANQKYSQPEVACNESLEKWLRRWLNEYVANNVRASTRVSYEGIVKHQLIPYIGKIKLGNLKKADIENMYSKLLVNGRADGKGGLSIKTIENVALCLHKALQTALEHEYIAKNPADIAKVPTLRSENIEKAEMNVLTKEEQKALIKACDYSVYGMGILTTLNTGLRLGELLGITWDDVDFEKNTISISKQVNRVHDYSSNAKSKTKLGIQFNTKTSSSTRIISMSMPLAEHMLKYKNIQQEHIAKWGKAYNDLNMVFAREDGWYVDPSTFRDNYLKILKKAGLEPQRFHTLRHTFATRALEAGVEAKIVSKILGHSTIQMTLDTYTHVLPQLQSEAMDKIVEYVGG